MKAIVQRVSGASVVADGVLTGKIDKGLVVFCGVEKDDDAAAVEKTAKKICALRIFPNEQGKMFYSVSDIKGQVLVISNFTLCASLKCGNRPDFTGAAGAVKANELYELFKSKISECVKTEAGVFGADMRITAENDGPVSIIVDSQML